MSGSTILNREELDKLERRELQLTVLSVEIGRASCRERV